MCSAMLETYDCCELNADADVAALYDIHSEK